MNIEKRRAEIAARKAEIRKLIEGDSENKLNMDDLEKELRELNEEDEKLPELIDKLDDIKDDLAACGVVFDYHFRDFHDRCIRTDKGWTINLGRGLDMFEKYSPFSVAAYRQDLRKCKECTITFLKDR